MYILKTYIRLFFHHWYLFLYILYVIIMAMGQFDDVTQTMNE